MRRMQCEQCTVRLPGMLCDLSPDGQKKFRLLAQASIYRPRQVIFAEGNPCAGLYLVCSGSVKVFHSDRFGRDHVLEIAGPGAVLGELPPDAEQGLSVSAEALTETQVSFLARERLIELLEEYPVAAMRLVTALSRELAAARRRARDLALKDAESRLAALLLELARSRGRSSSGSRVSLDYTRRDLAEMIGVSTETAIRLLGRLKSKRTIEIAPREFIILDVDRLARIAERDEVVAR